jgi:hypothetical protein
MQINIRTVLPAALIAVAGLPLSTVASSAAAPAKTTVTISAEGTDLSGTVASGRAACEADRTVRLYQQIGTRGGGDDVYVGQDTTEVVGDVGVWSTGNTGIAGRFYAKVTKTSSCKGAVSTTIRAART